MCSYDWLYGLLSVILDGMVVLVVLLFCVDVCEMFCVVIVVVVFDDVLVLVFLFFEIVLFLMFVIGGLLFFVCCLFCVSMVISCFRYFVLSVGLFGFGFYLFELLFVLVIVLCMFFWLMNM